MRQTTRTSKPYLSLLAGGWLLLAVHLVTGLGGSGTDVLFDKWLYNFLVCASAVMVIVRGLRSRDSRTAWLVLGAGMTAWAIGDIYFELALAGVKAPPFPSPADAGYLAFYPACYVALGLLVRDRVRELSGFLWLDGLVAGLAGATVAAALLSEPILGSAAGDPAAVATTLAYPLGDTLLLIFAVTALGLTGWRPGRGWLLIAISLVISAVADSTYLYQSARHAYTEGTWLDALWPASWILLASAAWTRWPVPARRRIDGPLLLLVPCVSLVTAVGVLLLGALGHVAPAGLVLAAATLLATIARLMATTSGHQRMLTLTRHEALTDTLTGLGNRRRLIEDLEALCRDAVSGRAWVLVLYDLNGFKRYNDTFGHPAGDALLARLGGKLAVAASDGRAYRMGGDEFCVLLGPAPQYVDARLRDTVAALEEHGSGFAVTTAHGAVDIPAEATEPSQALQLADERLYASKAPRDGTAARQVRDVLLQTFAERDPALRQHQRGVARLAQAVGLRLGLEPEQLDVLGRAAELHDVGKIAIPDAILDKSGRFSEEDWAFMRHHTILGQRILSAAPALRPVAELVRSSHERFDGRGYPDGLSEERIPLGARIIAVCDAYQAMTTDRMYAPALTCPAAIDELRRGAGTQFDPAVVDAVVDELTDAARAADRRPPVARTASEAVTGRRLVRAGPRG